MSAPASALPNAAVADSSRTDSQLNTQLQQARLAQVSWAEVSPKRRLNIFRRFRHLLAAEAESVAQEVSPVLPRSVSDTLSAEVFPLAEAIRYLELEAAKLLMPVQVSRRARPRWLGGVSLYVQRDPYGVVLVIGPANYPMFLPSVQAIQALVAGNAVFWKPGLGGAPVARAIAALLLRAGLPQHLLTVTDESIQAGQELLGAGIDKVVMTGSAESGRKVLHAAAEQLIPAVVELSGSDAFFVLLDADLVRSVDALMFGLRLNGSATCIAPRRVFLDDRVADSFKAELRARLSSLEPVCLKANTAALVLNLIDDALSKGASFLTERQSDSETWSVPIVLDHVNPSMAVMRTDVFAPIIGLCSFRNEAEALALANQCPYALGATVFGEQTNATAFAKRICTGIVVVNDIIVPTADPRVSFGGRRESGFGKSRGAEGLLDMTVSKTIAVQTAKRLRHLEPPHPQAAELFFAFLKILHGAGGTQRLRSIAGLIKLLAKKTESTHS